jgi:hypothetical protein
VWATPRGHGQIVAASSCYYQDNREAFTQRDGRFRAAPPESYVVTTAMLPVT